MSNARTRGKTAMRVSAIRFGSDVWRVLEEEASRVGVSVSQYVREAALARASAAAAARGGDPLDALAQAAGGSKIDRDSPEAPTRMSSTGLAVSTARDVRSNAQATRADAQAVRAQSEQASRRARQLAGKKRASE
ncbi:MAG: hypothetical protein ACTHM1_05035 [Solirubrobacteraceae bacterium]